MSKSCCGSSGGFKLIHTGDGVLKFAAVVSKVAVSGANLLVTNTDGANYTLILPKAEPANVTSIRLLNASGTTVVATVAVLV